MCTHVVAKPNIVQVQQAYILDVLLNQKEETSFFEKIS